MGAAGMRDGGGGGEGREGRMGEAVSHNQTQKWRKMKISWHHDVYAIKTGHKTIRCHLNDKKTNLLRRSRNDKI